MSEQAAQAITAHLQRAQRCAINLTTAPSWAVACSGGPDSLALLHLLTLTAQSLNRAVHALIIDHGLRPDSAQEAEHTATIAQDLGATPHLLRLSWAEKPTTGLQEKARDARHALLRHTCQQLKISHLFLGHQQDDLLETVYMRKHKDSGRMGLAGMPSISQRGGLWLHRPLLALSKSQLIAYCHSQALPFVTDPSNRNTAFERVRVREHLASLPEAERASLLAQQQEAARYRQQQIEDTRALNAIESDGGYAQLPLERAASLSPAQLWLLLSTIGQHQFGPGNTQLERVGNWLRNRPHRTTVQALTLAGCTLRLSLRQTQHSLIIAREAGSISAMSVAACVEHHQGLWDKRWHLTSPQNLPTTGQLEPLLNKPRPDADDSLWAEKLAHMPGIARHGLPLLTVSGQSSRLLTPDERVFCPLFNPLSEIFSN